MGPVLKERCKECIGSPSPEDGFALAMRLHFCNGVDLNDKIDFGRLSDMQ